jgi:hypothetical protein
VHLSKVGGYQLRDGARRLCRAMGSILARSSLPMKDWDTDDKPDRWLWLEITAAGALVGAGYLGFAFALWNMMKSWLS